uniref:PRESAN domain-containing protein n=1 Tax=Strongyloides papillosus TaxID=174720 RepID=A0A0N5BYV3_STREA
MEKAKRLDVFNSERRNFLDKSNGYSCVEYERDDKENNPNNSQTTTTSFTTPTSTATPIHKSNYSYSTPNCTPLGRSDNAVNSNVLKRKNLNDVDCTTPFKKEAILPTPSTNSKTEDNVDLEDVENLIAILFESSENEKVELSIVTDFLHIDNKKFLKFYAFLRDRYELTDRLTMIRKK